MPSIESAHADVQSAVAEAVQWANAGEARTLWEYETRAWALMLALGRALVVLFLARQMSRPRAVRYEYAGGRWELAESRTTTLATRFGRVNFTRRVGRRRTRGSSRRAKADLPIDRDLGLCGGFSPRVVMGIARLCAQMSFANARATWLDIYEWAPAPRAVMRMVDAAGGVARQFIEELPAPEDDGEVLVLQVDAGGAPMVSHAEFERRRKPKRKGQRSREDRREERAANPKPRRTKGKKSKNAKQAFTAVLYTLRRGADGQLDGPVNKRVISTFESHEALFIWLDREARKRGYGEKRTLFLADGSEHIWRLQQRFFPAAEACLDWFHLAEYLWKAGRSFHREGSAALRGWVKQQKQRLREAKIDAVLDELRERLAAIPRTGPGNKGRRERLAQVLGYIENHRTRMPYAKFIADGLDIGSGAVEGAIRNVVRVRLDGPGARWGLKRAEHVLHLRCILVSRLWDRFSEHIEMRDALALAPEPEPAEPHTARAAA